MKGSHWTKKLCGRKLQWEEETFVLLPVTFPGWSGLKLPQAHFFFLPPSLCRREIERRGERRRPQVTFLDYQLNAWGEWERKKEREWRRREVGIGWGKGKGVKKGVMFSFSFVSAWWLQAVDFHLTLLHIVLSLQSVWKLRPQRAEGRGKESKEV